MPTLGGHLQENVADLCESPSTFMEPIEARSGSVVRHDPSVPAIG